MLHPLISLSPDLKRLYEDGYEVDVRDGNLITSNVPYLDANGAVRRCKLISKLNLAGDVTAKPDDHTMMFIGEDPYNVDGNPITHLLESFKEQIAEDLVVTHQFPANRLTVILTIFIKLRPM